MKDHAVIVLRDGGKVLFVQRSATKKFLPNMWAFPSGTVEEGERPEVTVVREAKEELGVDVRVNGHMSTIELPELSARLLLFSCNAVDSLDAVTFDPGEIQAMRWMTFTDFFGEFSDSQIGHGLVALRKMPELWQEKVAAE